MSVAYPTTNYGVFNTNDWAVGSQVTNTGTLNCQILNAKQAVNTASLISSGGVSAVNVVASGSITGATVATTGAISAASVTATGAVSGATLTASGAVSGATLSSSGALTAGSISSSGAISGAGGQFSSLTVANGTTNTMTTDIAGNISSNSLSTAAGVTASGAGSFNSLAVKNTGTTTASISNVGAASVFSLAVNSALNITSGGALSTTSSIGASTMTATGAISGASVTSPNVTSTGNLTVGSSTITGTKLGYLSNSNAGTAGATTCLVTDSSNNIAGINSLSASSLSATSISGNSTLWHTILVPLYVSGQVVTFVAGTVNGWPGYYNNSTLANGQQMYPPTYTFSAPCAGTWRVIVTLLTGPGQGVVEFFINSIPYTYDCYAASYGFSTQTFDTPLVAGSNTFQMFPTGKNGSSSGYAIGFPFTDCLKMFRIS